jgi:hypothetical protein
MERAVDGLLDALEKKQMQSAVDALVGKVDLNLRDCKLLVNTGVLSDGTSGGPSPPPEMNVRELLARLQIGHVEAKERAVDGLLVALRRSRRRTPSTRSRGR